MSDSRDALAVKLLVFLSDDDTDAVLELLEQEGWRPSSEISEGGEARTDARQPHPA